MMPILQISPSEAPRLLAWKRFWAPHYQDIRTCGVCGLTEHEVCNDGIQGEAGRGRKSFWKDW